jgi:DNA-binding MurR/RpiR family transcriptional regulator
LAAWVIAPTLLQSPIEAIAGGQASLSPAETIVMTYEPVIEKIHACFDDLPPKLQAAARFLIDRPKEVALLSMREQARMAGVQPATMTRLAQTLGFSGYDELKSVFADAIRGDAGSFSSRAISLVAKQRQIGDAGLISDYIDILNSHLTRLKTPSMIRALIDAAASLRTAKIIYALGLRSVFPVAYQFSYVQSYFSDQVILLEGPGGTGLDRIQWADSDSALLIVSIAPYAAQSVALATEAHKRGIKIVAITDSIVSPIGRIADVAVCVETVSPSFFDTITPSFVVGEILVALLAAHIGPDVTARIHKSESRLQASGSLWRERPQRRSN